MNRSDLVGRYSSGVLNRAEAVEPVPQRPGLFLVPSTSNPRVSYSVQVLTMPGGEVLAICSCPNGRQRGARVACVHSAAVLLRW